MNDPEHGPENETASSETIPLNSQGDEAGYGTLHQMEVDLGGGSAGVEPYERMYPHPQNM